MSRLIARAAMPAHSRDIAALLRRLGVTRPLSVIARAMTLPRAAWHVVETEDGSVVGVQWIEPSATGGHHAADIATFTAEGPARLATGSALFEATKAAALRLGYRWLVAEFDAGNQGALVYYRSRGFEPVGGGLAGTRASGRIVLVHELM